MNITFAASEGVPFSKTGGLADVVGALPRALAELGHNVTIFLPRYKLTKLPDSKVALRSMTIPFDEGLGIHPQDDFFLDREVWDLSKTPDELRPLLLHYHPLVIYRFQVLKQADVALTVVSPSQHDLRSWPSDSPT